MNEIDAPQRIYHYVDGFNLYHGCFSNTGSRSAWRQFRWLDIFAFCSRIYPKGNTQLVRYFTAHVEPEADDPENAVRQQVYLRALRTLPKVTIHTGRFSRYAKLRVVADPTSRKVVPLVPAQKALVIEHREKGSDVNLASYLLLDAFEDKFDLAVVITNDSDLATPIRMVREQLGKQIAIVNPRKRVAIDLRDLANSYRSIRRVWLENAQFSDVLQDEHGEFRKPEKWN